MNKEFEELLQKISEVGFVKRVWQWLVEVEGLPGAGFGECVVFESGQKGRVSGLDGEVVEVFVLSVNPVRVGERVARTGRQMEVAVGEQTLGSTIDVTGKILRTWQKMSDTDSNMVYRPLDSRPLGIVGRKRISRQMETGVVVVDMMIPIGCGQRELVMGDRKTGKSYLLWCAMANQARKGTVCVYVAVGKKKAEVVRVEQFFSAMGVGNNCVIVAAALEESAGEIFLAPYAGMAVAEYFRDRGRDVLLVLDDMTTHAKFYRELSLIGRRFPGRDSYPGDIFYIHSRLLERAGNFWVSVDGASEPKEVAITCLPVVETIQGDVAGYIQTNMMSMTDGHVYFDSELFFKGRRPAINAFVSVTRVGRQTQSKLARDIAKAMFDLLNSYEKTQSFLRFGAELGENSRQILVLGDRLLKFFDQPDFLSVPLPLAMIAVAMLLSGLWDGKNLNKLVELYESDAGYRQKIIDLSLQSDSFSSLLEKLRMESGGVLGRIAAG